MAAEKGLVRSYVLERDNALPAVDFQHAVDQQKGVTMGKNALYLLNVELAAIQDIGLCKRYVRFITHAVLWFAGQPWPPPGVRNPASPGATTR